MLNPGGVFVASSPSRWNDPELEGIDPNWGTPSTFDVEVDRWDLVGFRLPTTEAIADHLHAFNVEGWQEKPAAIPPPMTITKRGAEVWAYK